MLCAAISLAQDFTDDSNGLSYRVTSTTAPLTVEIIGYSGGTSVNIPATVINDTYTYQITVIGNRAFEGDDFGYEGYGLLTNITFSSPSNLTSIGERAFAGQKLVEVTIPNSVITIGARAFEGGYYGFEENSGTLTNVTFNSPSNLTSIGERAFAGQKLVEVTIPNSVITIGTRAFEGDDFGYGENTGTLTNLTFNSPSNLTNIGDRAFSGQKIVELTIPNSVITIGPGAFEAGYTHFGQDTGTLTNLTFNSPSNLTSIGEWAFAGQKLVEVTIPKSVITIGARAFEAGYSEIEENRGTLTNFTFNSPSNLTNIGDAAFLGQKLVAVTIPNNVTMIGGYAFWDNELTEVTSSSRTPASLPTYSFTNKNTIDLRIPSGTETAYVNAGWTGFKSVITFDNVTSGKSNGSYGAGEVIPIQITFEQAVTVTGTPQLTLETGATDHVVNYTSGSGTHTLTFAYTVQTGDESLDLDYISTTALALNGGSIKEATGNDAVLTLPAPGTIGSLGANKALVVDAAAPIITLTGANPQIIDEGDGYSELGAMTDDGSSVTIDASDFVAAVGSYSVTYNATDALGNTATEVTRTVNVVDTTAPVITLTGDDLQTIELGAGYSELGATTDDGTTVNIDSNAFVDAVGTYAITYNATDAAGNNATEVTRTVNVEDTTAPAITLIGYNPLYIELGTGYVELGATTNDGSTVTIDASAFVDTIGNYSITYNATDAAGNNATEVTRTVNVEDTTAPVITLTGDNPQTIELGAGYSELGATTDDGSTVNIDSSAFVNAVGTYTITYNATDAAGNAAAELTRTVNVADTTDTIEETPEITINVPKGFSPNGDGINDTWVIENLQEFPNHTLHLYNRVGNEVFTAKDYQNNWGGISNGNRVIGGSNKLPTGAYYYVIDTGSQAAGSLTGWIYINY